MNPRAVMELLNEIETQLPVDTWFVEDVPVWPVLRIYLLFALDNAAPPAASAPARPSPLKLGTQILSRAIRGRRRHREASATDAAHEDRIAGPVDVAFLSHTTCRTFRLVDGGWYDSFCQPVIELLNQRGRSSFVFEYAPDDEYRVPRANRSLLVEPPLAMFRVWNEVVSARHVALPGESELRAIVRARAGFDPAFALVRKRLRLIRRMATFFRAQLERLTPSVGFVVNYYDARCMAFILACRELGIRSVDIQHGVQGELHGAYGRWRRVPKNGYSLLPSVFWCWSDEEARALRAWTDATGGVHSALVAGNLLLSRFLDATSALAQSFDGAVTERVKAAECNLLITLQPARDLPPFVRAAIAEAPPSWQWWLRLHPAMRADAAGIAANLRAAMPRARIIIEEASEVPLYAVLRHMDVHVTELSSTVVEAERFGVPSVVCSAAGAELFADAIARGVALLAESQAALLAAIAHQRARKATLPRIRPPVIDADALDGLVRGARARGAS